MHLKRTQVSKKYPIPRKGTKYIARAGSHFDEGVPVVVAIRDMLGIARTSKEVKQLLNQKKIKINGKNVKDVREGVRLFNVLSADKDYELTILPTGRYAFEEKKGDSRLCKVINKKILKGNKIQLNLHDGTNILAGKEKTEVDDSLLIGYDNKIKKVLQMEKGKEVFVFSGKSVGKIGKIEKVDGKKANVKFEDKEVSLETSHLIVK